MIDKSQIFYMVHVEGSSYPPASMHTSRRSADKEAERLTECTGKVSYVLRTVGMFYAESVIKPSYKVMGCSLGDDNDLQ